jgi:hypothetical protein
VTSRMLRIANVLIAISSVCAPPRMVTAEPASPTIEFARDIRPILAANCFQCHGPDAEQREADLRLDQREAVLGEEGASRVVIAGAPNKSELYRRITAPDEDSRMPPPESRDRLRPAQIELIRQWIRQGAKWQPHWAFVGPARPALPTVETVAWARNGIDAFVLSRLEQEGLTSSPEADRDTLIRRVTFDLTGLPPTLEEIDAFRTDKAPGAYERIVDRLLDSPRYGERMAVDWLNAARYADTYGYQDDGEVSMWRWRDWVIEAFNANMPFDQFTIEQLAGDLLPNPTLEQRLATGFNRNHRANSEGGAIPEEFRTEYVVDRVDTTATVWLGLTMICARCHDHKYDPIRQRDFYKLFAFFNNVPEDGRARKQGNTPPFIPAPTREEQAREAELQGELQAAQLALANLEPEITRLQAEWEESVLSTQLADFTVTRSLESHFPLDGSLNDEQKKAKEVQAVGGAARYDAGRLEQCLVMDGNYHVDAGDVADFSDDDKFTFAAWIWPEEGCSGSVVSRTENGAKPEGIDLLAREGRIRVHLNVQWIDDSIRLEVTTPLPMRQWTHVAFTVDGSEFARGVHVYFNGIPQPVSVEIDSLYQSFGNNGPLRIGASGDPASRLRGRIDDVRVYDDELTPAEIEIIATPASVSEIIARPANQRNAGEAHKLRACFLARFAPEQIMAAAQRVDAAQQALKQLVAGYPTVMVMEEQAERRPTHVLYRGKYDEPREEVLPDVPTVLPPLPAGVPRNRLSLARWLVDPRNPLTARVTVNRLWQMSFGVGLVKTAEDFGSQAEPPSHPLLLDWLAREFVDSGWNVKAMRRLIVTSATYQQSSNVTPRQLAIDPSNRLLSRGPRFRLPAEMIRDQALFASGLLVEHVGGPSAKPYQPPGLWEELSNDKYKQDHGEQLYRRSLYTFWKRTIPFPAMALFDAPNRETCCVRGDRTNTPLQALTLMNETSFVEASRALAERVLREGRGEPTGRLDRAFRIVTCRDPQATERQVLQAGFARHLEHYRRHLDEARMLIAVGEKQPPESIDEAKLAAYTAIANLLLNLDEAITQH